MQVDVSRQENSASFLLKVKDVYRKKIPENGNQAKFDSLKDFGAGKIPEVSTVRVCVRLTA